MSARMLVVVGAMLMATPSMVQAAEPVGVLTLDAARTRALEGHPTLLRLRAQVRAAEARADQIGTALNPTLAGQVGADVGGGVPPSEFGDPQATIQAGVAGSWTITDFGRVSALERAARVGIEADEESIKATERDILNAVDEAYWNARASAELVAVAEANLAAETRHREEAQRFVDAGTRAAIEVARAKTQEARAKTEVVRAKTAVRQALVQLGFAMGLAATPDGVDGAWSQPLAEESAQIDALATEAYGLRAEVEVQRRRVKAAEAYVAAAEKGQLPFLTADASLGVGAVNPFDDWKPVWNVGVTLTWPFYDGGQTSAAVEAARADLAAAKVVLQELEIGVHAQISSSIEAIVSAKAEIDAAAATREAAEVELKLAEERWKQGLGSGIELADAQTRLLIAASDRTRAELSLALARARLVRAIGR